MTDNRDNSYLSALLATTASRVAAAAASSGSQQQTNTNLNSEQQVTATAQGEQSNRTATELSHQRSNEHTMQQVVAMHQQQQQQQLQQLQQRLTELSTQQMLQQQQSVAAGEAVNNPAVPAATSAANDNASSTALSAEVSRAVTLHALQFRQQQVQEQQKLLIAHQVSLLRARQQEEQRVLHEKQLAEIRAVLSPNTSLEQFKTGLQQQGSFNTSNSTSNKGHTLANITGISLINSLQTNSEVNTGGQLSNQPQAALQRRLQEMLLRAPAPNQSPGQERNNLIEQQASSSLHAATVTKAAAAAVATSTTTGSKAAPVPHDKTKSIEKKTVEGDTGDRKKPGRPKTFPRKLLQMLTDLENDGKSNVASFLPHGRSFIIHNPEIFERDVVPKYFRMGHFSSFQRQLNIYDFRRVAEGPDKGAFFHELFIRGRSDLCDRIERRKSTPHNAAPAATTTATTTLPVRPPSARTL